MVKAVVLEERDKLSLRDIKVEEKLGRRDVRIGLRNIGICGSDVHYYTHGKIGPFEVRAPMILGHEASGVILEAGADVSELKEGDRVWVKAEVTEEEVAWVAAGMPAVVEAPSLAGRRFEGTLAWVYPSVSESRRTARVRVELANPEERLLPDMFVNVHLRAEPRERLVVPLSAVLHAGERSFVFLDLGGGRLRPQPVEVGPRFGEEVEILAGIEEGQAVVASATFLVAAESRLRAALDRW